MDNQVELVVLRPTGEVVSEKVEMAPHKEEKKKKEKEGDKHDD